MNRNKKITKIRKLFKHYKVSRGKCFTGNQQITHGPGFWRSMSRCTFHSKHHDAEHDPLLTPSLCHAPGSCYMNERGVAVRKTDIHFEKTVEIYMYFTHILVRISNKYKTVWCRYIKCIWVISIKFA